jgi:hypothetical protein
MSQPVFGRKPSRPLPRDGDSEPTEELEIDLTDDKHEAVSQETEPGAEPAVLDDEDAEAAEPAALDVEELESGESATTETEGESAGLDVEELESGESATTQTEGEPAGLDVEELESGESATTQTEGEPAGLDVEELDGEPVALDVEHPAPAEPVMVDAEAVSAEPHRAHGADDAWTEIQAQFVDDPQAATAGALRMLRERLDSLAPAGASTEDLRVAFRRYRAAYFDLAET